MRRPRLVYVVTHPTTADLLLRGQLGFMREHGFDVTVVASPGPELDRVAEREGVAVVPVAMAREPNPRDGVSLLELTRALRRLRPDIVNASTPKAGLLGMMAARAIRCPARIYLLRGLRLETAHGILHAVLSSTEKVASACAHDVVSVSPSLNEVAVRGGWVPASKARVVGAGMSNGVDTERFRRTEQLREEGTHLLGELGVAPGDYLVGFVGRLVADKGIEPLVDAFIRLSSRVPRAKLVLLGGGLAGDDVTPHLRQRLAHPSIIVGRAVRDLAPYYARFDVLAFPSRREGFPNVPIEAASMEVPVVGSRATGVVDAVVDGETGALVEPDDTAAFAAALESYGDQELRTRHGRAGRRRVEQLFDRHQVWHEWLRFYEARLDGGELEKR